MSKDLERQFDIAKKAIFTDKRCSAFYGSLWCSLNFSWDTSIPTACTNGLDLRINPDWFLSKSPSTRENTLLHELDHVARLHSVRIGSRDPKIWNWACDIRINNDRMREGAVWNDFTPWYDFNVDIPRILAEEEIYDLFVKQPPSGRPRGKPGSSGGDPKDLEGDVEASPTGASPDKTKLVGAVVRAIQAADIAGGQIPGNVRKMVETFLKPIVPWERELMEWFTERMTFDYTWRRPNRRSSEVYLPSMEQTDGELDHLMYFLDVSASISWRDVLRFNSEVKYIQEVLRPKKLTLVQFDTRITQMREFEIDDPFEGIEIIGRGGTMWGPVRKCIQEHQPTAAIVFTDMGFADSVNPPSCATPVLWVVTQGGSTRGPFGRTICLG